ncbi:T9SS type A sorting domain-containing protein [Chryseobacterium sp. SSA4.19]|uniref:T9SS type A sorting domain-containing protein n=1 Tax=Chryseobacterium sp. SSA4.19 TaxID=2919915 RepID=UPI001F4EE6A0|nr:T9SS type A sorting domain-containing protein [Chryseobacterium sp. SSA4.19]MCJ8154869.1 T9SS type A sorting domain-containing protein [Chryseobacterium sp. SSA4.19]
MVKIYFSALFLLFGSFLFNAQNVPPCSDFNDPSNPYGNWAPSAPPNGNVSVGVGSANALDGSQFLIIKDKSGGSWYENWKDYQYLGKNFLGQCIYFDFYLENDSGYGMPYHPYITLSDGTNNASFVASVTVTPGSGWVRIKAPIQLSSGGVLPSNSDGAWTMSTVNAAIFDNIIMNSQVIGITPDITTTQQEVVFFDNICVKPCEGCNECNSNFKIQTTTSTSGNYTVGQVFLESTNSPSLYKVDWGDGTLGDVLTSHVYTNPGSYTVCVIQYEGDKPKCKTCLSICIPKPAQGGDGKNPVNVKSPLNQVRDIALVETGIPIQAEYTLVPNPAKNYVDVITNLSKKGSVSIRIIDSSGKILTKSSETVNSGRQSIRIDTEKLIQGVYMVEVNAENKTNFQKLIISK